MGFFEAIDNVDNPLHRFAGALASGWTRMFGSRNDRLIREILPKGVRGVLRARVEMSIAMPRKHQPIAARIAV